MVTADSLKCWLQGKQHLSCRKLQHCCSVQLSERLQSSVSSYCRLPAGILLSEVPAWSLETICASRRENCGNVLPWRSPSLSSVMDGPRSARRSSADISHGSTRCPR